MRSNARARVKLGSPLNIGDDHGLYLHALANAVEDSQAYVLEQRVEQSAYDGAKTLTFTLRLNERW